MWVCVYIFVVECICVRGRHMQVCAGSQMSTLSAVPLLPSTLASPKLANLTTTAGQQSPETHLSPPSEGWDCKPITQSQGFKKKVAPEGPTQVPCLFYKHRIDWAISHPHLAFDCGHFFRTFSWFTWRTPVDSYHSLCLGNLIRKVQMLLPSKSHDWRKGPPPTI